MKTPYPDVELTLTKAELAAPFQITDPDPDPLPEPTRLFLISDGVIWKALDRSGTVLEQGEIVPDHFRK
jgi:hypothetical protein